MAGSHFNIPLLRRRRFTGGGGASLYAVNGSDPATVADFSGLLNSGTEYYRTGGSDTTFDSMFSYTGASAKTMTDSDGLLKWAPHNYALNSEDLSSASYGGFYLETVTDTDGPFGTNTAVSIVPDSTTNRHQFYMNGATNTIPSGNLRRGFFVAAKANGMRYLRMFQVGNLPPRAAYITVDLQDGGVEETYDAGYLWDIDEVLTPVDLGDGWWMCGFFVKNGPLDIYRTHRIQPSNNAINPNTGWVESYLGNSTDGILISGWQICRGDLGIVFPPGRSDYYVPTTGSATFLPRRNHYRYDASANTFVNKGILLESEAATNIITKSNDFSTTWTTNNTGSLGTATGPDGVSGSATDLVDSGATGTGEVYLDWSVTVSTSTTYTFSCYVKSDQLSFVALGTENFTTPGNVESYFNLSTGAAGTAGTGHTAVIEDVGGGWHRCAVTFTTDGTDTTGNLRVYVADGDTDNTVDLDGTSSILIYGAQLEAGSVPSSYIPTVVATATRAAETLTIAGSDMAASTSNMSIHMEGEITYADNGATSDYTFWRWYNGASDYLLVDLDTDSTDTGEINAVQDDTVGGTGTVTSDSLSPGINVAYNFATRHTSSEINLAVGGTAVTADTTPTALHDASGDTFQLAYDYMGTISLFRAWDADLGDTGIEDASS